MIPMKTYLLLATLLSCFKTHALVMSPSHGQAFSAETGIYSLSSSASSFSGLGLLNLEYLKAMNLNWAGSVAYTQFLDNPSHLSSSINGFDIKAHWCWKACRPFKKESDPTGAVYSPGSTQTVLFGFSQRNFQLTNETIAFSGLKIGYEYALLYSGAFSPYARVAMDRLINGHSELNIVSLAFGARWWF
jgi:hypothetical protein